MEGENRLLIRCGAPLQNGGELQPEKRRNQRQTKYCGINTILALHMVRCGTLFCHMKHFLSRGRLPILFNKNEIQMVAYSGVFHDNKSKGLRCGDAAPLLFIVLDCAFFRAQFQDVLPVGEVDGVDMGFLVVVGGHEEAGVGFFVAFPGKAPHIGVDQLVADFLDG